MAKLTFEVRTEHWREIKAARRAGVDVVIIPADKYARLMRREAIMGQIEFVEVLTRASENPKLTKQLEELAQDLRDAVTVLETAAGDPELERSAS